MTEEVAGKSLGAAPSAPYLPEHQPVATSDVMRVFDNKHILFELSILRHLLRIRSPSCGALVTYLMVPGATIH